MKLINKTSLSLITGFLVLLTTLALPVTKANAEILAGDNSLPFIITQAEINNLLQYYSLDEETPGSATIIIEIFDKNDELIFSDNVCRKIYDCDERLNSLINQSDFITEIDNTKIYILNQ